MDIKSLAGKLKQRNIEFEIIEESLNYPILSFTIMPNKFIFFYRENFIRRSKFHKKYNTYIEIEVIDKSDVSFLESEINKIFSCQYCIDENKVYANISKIEEDRMIDFITKLKK